MIAQNQEVQKIQRQRGKSENRYDSPNTPIHTWGFTLLAPLGLADPPKIQCLPFKGGSYSSKKRAILPIVKSISGQLLRF